MSLGNFFSQRLGYAAHAMGYIAKKPYGSLTTVAELTEWLRQTWPQASGPYLSNVLQKLAHGGLLRSQRGTGGGFVLARSADEITMRDLLEVLEGVRLDRCSLALSLNCPHQETCPNRCAMFQVEEQFLQSLQNIKLDYIAKNMDE